MERMRAWAWGLRRILPISMAGRRHIGAEFGAAGDLVQAVGPVGPRADEVEC